MVTWLQCRLRRGGRKRAELPTSNIEHPTSNIEHRSEDKTAVSCQIFTSMLDVGCSKFDVRFNSNADDQTAFSAKKDFRRGGSCPPPEVRHGLKPLNHIVGSPQLATIHGTIPMGLVP